MGKCAAAVWAGWPGHSEQRHWDAWPCAVRTPHVAMALMTYGTSCGNTWGQCGAVGAGGLGRHFAWRRWPVIVDLGSPAAATHSSTSVWDQQFGRKTLCWWNGSLMFLGSFVSEDPLPILISQSSQFSGRLGLFQAMWQLYN